MPPQVGQLVFERGQSRLIDPLNLVLIQLSSLGMAASWIMTGSITYKPGDVATVECKIGPYEFRLPVHGPVQTAIQEALPDAIQIDVLRKIARQDNVDPGTGQTGTAGFDKVLTMVFSPVFVEFFERYKKWISDNISNDPSQWPSPLNFYRVVRNSISHGGRIRFDNPRAAAVTWYGLQYSPADNGRATVGADLNIGDMLLLMLELSEQLDAAGCPIDP